MDNIEIEHKFLIETPELDFLEQIALKRLTVTQIYLNRNNQNVERRIRVIKNNGIKRYYYTEKSEISYGTRTEVESEITEKEFIELLKEKDDTLNTIKKTCYAVPFEEHILEIDIFELLDGYATLEIEVDDITKNIKLPEWVTVISNVTDNKRFRNANLARLNREEISNLVQSQKK